MKNRAFTGLEVLGAIAVIAVAAWLGAPKAKQFFQDRKIAKQERKLDENQHKQDAAARQVATQDEKQIETAHVLIAGVNDALGRVPETQQTPEVKAASELGRRAESAQAAGRNAELTPEQRAYIHQLVSEMISPVLAESKAAQDKLLKLSVDLNDSVNRERELRSQLASLQKDREALQHEKDALVETRLAQAAFAERLWFFIKLGLVVFTLVALCAGYFYLQLRGVGQALHLSSASGEVISEIDDKLSAFGKWIVRKSKAGMAAAESEAKTLYTRVTGKSNTT